MPHGRHLPTKNSGNPKPASGRDFRSKLLKCMKLTALFLLAVALHVSARSFSQKVTLSGRDLPLDRIFQEIRSQTGYAFVCDMAFLREAHPVSLEVQDASLESVLDICLQNQGLTYQIKNGIIVILKAAVLQAPVLDSPPLSQKVYGFVRDDKGIPIDGATVVIKAGAYERETITDARGQFSFVSVPDGGYTVEVTCIGFQRTLQVVSLKSVRSVVVVAMRPSISYLDDAVVIGYGTSSRRQLTGSVSKVTAEEIETQPVDNVLDALQGRVAGMQISAPLSAGSLPGGAPVVKIRGTNSISAGTSPLYILDGVPLLSQAEQTSIGGILGGDISELISLNPNDIESVEVLKDADATSIYGSRGANGVVLITTKKGKPGRTAVSVHAYTGVASVEHYADLLNVHQYNAMRREAMANDHITPTAQNSPDLFTWDSTKTYDWQRLLFGHAAPSSDVDLSMSGGDATTRFLLDAAYHTEGTTMPGNSGMNRKTFRFNLNHVSPNGKFTADATASYSINAINLLSGNLQANMNLAPDYPLYNPDGTPNYSAPSGYPLAYLEQPFSSTTSNYSGHGTIRYSPIHGLNLKIDAGFNDIVTNESQEQPASSLGPTSGLQGILDISSPNSQTWIAEPQADYTFHFRKHGVTLLAGGTWQQTNQYDYSAFGYNFPNDALIGSISAASTVSSSNTTDVYAYTAGFGRINYNWNQEVLANISFRRDGSSRFGPGKRFGNFGGIGVGWIFTEEKAVMKTLPWLSFGKIRGSYGTNGNDQIPDYGYLSTYSASGTGGSFYYQGTSLTPNSLANPDYRWERDRKLDLGLDLGIFRDRILVTADVFRNRTDNQLINYVLSPQSGFSGYQANFPALLQNQGWEVEITSKNITHKHFSWKTAFNLSASSNKLLKFPNIDQTSYFNQYFVGQSLSVIQGYMYQGLDSIGRPKLADLNHDGVVSTLDRVIFGNNDPLFGGISNDFRLGNFDLNFFWSYTRLRSYNSDINAGVAGRLDFNPSVLYLDRWQKPGDETKTNIPAFTTNSSFYNGRYFSQSSLWWENKNILRLNNVSLSYNLPASWLRSARIQNLQVYMHAQNLWTADENKYRLDPETGNNAMPPLRTWTFGINCTL